jgi:hypothetical protein
MPARPACSAAARENYSYGLPSMVRVRRVFSVSEPMAVTVISRSEDEPAPVGRRRCGLSNTLRGALQQVRTCPVRGQEIDRRAPRL